MFINYHNSNKGSEINQKINIQIIFKIGYWSLIMELS